jgi:hypothetical protein
MLGWMSPLLRPRAVPLALGVAALELGKKSIGSEEALDRLAGVACCLAGLESALKSGC